MYLKNQLFIYRSSTPMHTECVIMGENYYQDYTKAPTMMSAPNEAAGFEVSDFFEFNDWIMNEEDPMFSGYDNNHPQINPTTNHTEVYSSGISCSSNLHERTSCNNRESGIGKKETKEKVAFKTKSEVEVLDDGFKWRKYGKKMVKNSPNPRNYYRCSVEGCTVKKRVERDTEDPRYVVTTYEGIHNHQGPQM